MKYKALVMMFAFALAGCGDTNPQIADQAETNANTADNQKLETMTAHSADRGIKTQPPTGGDDGSGGGKAKWTRGGDPIDTTGFDKAIAAAEKELKGSNGSEASKKTLSQAYFKRADALTQARQYASAIGDYRRALKYDPGNAEAKQWIEQIIVIYNGLNKEYPKEGEEPEPLPFEKDRKF